MRLNDLLKLAFFSSLLVKHLQKYLIVVVLVLWYWLQLWGSSNFLVYHLLTCSEMYESNSFRSLNMIYLTALVPFCNTWGWCILPLCLSVYKIILTGLMGRWKAITAQPLVWWWACYWLAVFFMGFGSFHLLHICPQSKLLWLTMSTKSLPSKRNKAVALTSPKPPFPNTLYCRNVFFVTGCLLDTKRNIYSHLRYT